MKEMLNSDISSIEDREMRSLIRYEQLIAWGKSGGVQRAIAAYRAQIADADQAKAVAERRIAQINVLDTTVAKFDGRVIRNAQISAVAAKHRAEAAERQAIQEACDEIMALEEIVPADDMDDILSLSSALGIELPTDADNADICQRGHKSIEDLKRELGPPVWASRMVVHENDRFHELRKSDRFAKMIADYSMSVTSFQHIKANTNDESMWVEAFDQMLAKRDRLFGAITTLRDYATDLVAAKDEPPFPLHRLKRADPVARAPWNGNLSKIELWALSHFERLTDDVWEWIAANEDKPEWAEDVIDTEALDLAWQAANDQADAGRTLRQMGWSPPSGGPPDPPYRIARAKV